MTDRDNPTYTAHLNEGSRSLTEKLQGALSPDFPTWLRDAAGDAWTGEKEPEGEER